MPHTCTLRRFDPGDTALLRTLRLRALRDAPDSFGETWAEASVRTEDDWARWLAQLVDGPHAGFVAESLGSACGMAMGRVVGDEARVGGMWVEPAFRSRGIGQRLLGEVLEWARSKRLGRVGLWAPAHAPAALALYRSAGFTETGARKEHRPGMLIVEMRRDGGT